MIYEIRTYTLKPGNVAEYEKRFADGIAVRSTYSSLYGLWHTEIGPLNQIVHIWAYESLQKRADIRAAASNDASGRWPPKTSDLLAAQETDILVPRLYQLFPYKNWDHRDAVRGELREKRIWPPHSEERAVSQLVRHMIPAAFSPLK